jgi:hypothetical protein
LKALAFAAKRGISAMAQSPERRMTIGETTYVAVEANKFWNDSGIHVMPGQTYNFIVPENEEWIDWYMPCSADGYRSTPLIRPWETLRRVPNANWLQLIGTIGRSKVPPILIGSKLMNFSPPFPGRLYFFANDLAWMYWNNKGTIAVRLTRNS